MKRLRNTIFGLLLLAGIVYANYQGSMLLVQHPEMYQGIQYL